MGRGQRWPLAVRTHMFRTECMFWKVAFDNTWSRCTRRLRHDGLPHRSTDDNTRSMCTRRLRHDGLPNTAANDNFWAFVECLTVMRRDLLFLQCLRRSAIAACMRCSNSVNCGVVAALPACDTCELRLEAGSAGGVCTIVDAQSGASVFIVAVGG